MPPGLQPGSGSWDPFIALSGNVSLDRFRFDASVFYKVNTKGAQQFDEGDFLSIQGSAAYRFLFTKYPWRMTALEGVLGLTLFIRRRDGYELTSAGKDLLEHAQTVEQGVLAIEAWRSAIDPRPLVRIAAGAWTSIFIARHLPHLVKATEDLAIEIMTGTASAALLHREANLGLRNRRPETPGLAGKRLGRVEFAIYGQRQLLSERPEASDERRLRRSRPGCTGWR